jgi:hypothetical protein
LFTKILKNLASFTAKHNAYSTWEAQRYFADHKSKNNAFNIKQEALNIRIASGSLPPIGAYFCTSL